MYRLWIFFLLATSLYAQQCTPYPQIDCPPDQQLHTVNIIDNTLKPSVVVNRGKARNNKKNF